MINILLVLWFLFCFMFYLSSVKSMIYHPNQSVTVSEFFMVDSRSIQCCFSHPSKDALYGFFNGTALTKYMVNKLCNRVWFEFKPDFFFSLERFGVQFKILFHIYSNYYLPEIFLFVSVLVHFVKRKSLMKIWSQEVRMEHQSTVYILYYLVIFKCLHHFKC